MPRIIRFGIIGCGLMGREFASAVARWCHLLRPAAKPQLVAVCDPSPLATAWFSDNFDLSQVVTDYRELLANPEVEVVYCAVPHNLHEEVYIATLKAGKHLFAEKPYGIDLRAAENIESERLRHPELLVRCSSEFPFYPAVQRIAKMIESKAFGQIIEWRSGFLHSSDLDPEKPINWKRKVATCGEYGCMGDLGLHVVHLPFRYGLIPTQVHATLSRVYPSRPDPRGGRSECETWDNAVLSCRSEDGIPMFFETKRISPGDANSWFVKVSGTKASAEFTTKYPCTLRTMTYTSGGVQSWQEADVKYDAVYPCITGPIFEFGFTDSILQMWASFIGELSQDVPKFGCATPEEALLSHRLFTAALQSHRENSVASV
jgi:predicted dehydrogenase